MLSVSVLSPLVLVLVQDAGMRPSVQTALLALPTAVLASLACARIG